MTTNSWNRNQCSQKQNTLACIFPRISLHFPLVPAEKCIWLICNDSVCLALNVIVYYFNQPPLPRDFVKYGFSQSWIRYSFAFIDQEHVILISQLALNKCWGQITQPSPNYQSVLQFLIWRSIFPSCSDLWWFAAVPGSTDTRLQSWCSSDRNRARSCSILLPPAVSASLKAWILLFFTLQLFRLFFSCLHLVKLVFPLLPSTSTDPPPQLAVPPPLVPCGFPRPPPSPVPGCVICQRSRLGHPKAGLPYQQQLKAKTW